MTKQQYFSQQLDLECLGFDSFFRNQLPAHPATLRPARVVRVAGARCDVLTAAGPCQVHLPRKHRSPPPVVGDWLTVDDDVGKPQATSRLMRKTQLVRAAAGKRTRAQVIAANIDRVFVVMGLDGDFNPRRLERYLAMCADAGIEVVVFLTKAQACPDVDTKVSTCRDVMPPGTALALHPIDVVAGLGRDLPLRYTPRGVTVALVGSSGAGKSTLVNHILNSEAAATGEVRAGDDRGRHTTTHRELWCTPSGGIVIDNPGIRELGLWIEGDGL
ncbi:MAG: GTPase RsgA, partial [Nannocystaceae bacterium]